MHLIIIMEPFASEEKGLFTFYREQADFQEFLRLKKSQSKAQTQQVSKIEKSCISKSDHERKKYDKEKIIVKPLPRRSIHIKSPFEESIHQKDEKIDLEDEQISSKILHLLQKNAPSNSPSENIKSIVHKLNHIEQQQKRKQRNALKIKLYKQSKKQALNKQSTLLSKQMFIPKNDFPFKSNPFQKLALQPRSFSSELSDYKYQQLEKKNIQNSFVLNRNKAKQILNMSSQQLENQSPSAKIKPIKIREAIDDLTQKFCSQPLQKVLPKVNFKQRQNLCLKKQPYFKIINAQKIMNQYKSAEKMQFSRSKERNSEQKRYDNNFPLKDQIVLTSRRSMILEPTNGKFNIFLDSNKGKLAQMSFLQEKDKIFAQMMKKIVPV